MKFNQWIKSAVVGSAMLFLAACHSSHRNDDNAVNDANSAYSNSGAQPSGLGGGSGFGSEESGSQDQLSKRVYYFDFDRSTVRDEDRSAIAANADHVMANPKARVLLEGHSDPRGSREYNVGLGERRAKAVADILTTKGVNPAQIRIVSYGAEKLAAPGYTEADYQKDRRVVLVYLQR
jgi:peptidoglycan-associated lipoprotein